MTAMHLAPRSRDTARSGWVARLSSGGWTNYHRTGCPYAQQQREPIRDVVRGPWRYLSHHWSPCPHCRPPADPARTTRRDP